jgi:hypothetical protein
MYYNNMKKYLIRLGLVGTLSFLVLFVYFYKTSGNFRRSIISAFVVLTVFFSSQQAAHSDGQADAFTLQNQQHQSRPPNKGFFSHTSNNDGPGPGKPNGNGSDGDDGGIPKYPKTESIEETERHLYNIDEQIKKLEEVTDSDSESEENECRLKSKAGFKELPDGKIFVYDMDQGRGLIKQAKKVWKNPKAEQEVLRMLNRFDDENANIQEKPLKGFTNLTELKNSGPGPRIIIYRGKNEPPTVIAFCMRNDLDATLDKLKGKYT